MKWSTTSNEPIIFFVLFPFSFPMYHHYHLHSSTVLISYGCVVLLCTVLLEYSCVVFCFSFFDFFFSLFDCCY
jgi:hypothetical protein